MNISRSAFALPSVQDTSRSEGVHVTDLIRSMALRAGLLSDPVQDSPGRDLRMQLGLAWEDYLARRLKETIPYLVYHPGECYLDGVWGSPDAYDPDSDRVLEFKLTWKSARWGLSKEWMWLVQLQAYCRMLECVRGSIVVLYVNGDYEHRPGSVVDMTPKLVWYDIEFRWEDVMNVWRTLLAEKEHLERSAGSGLEVRR